MMDYSIAAARASGARILLPGTWYNFGSGKAQPLREDTAQRPSSRKGAIRVQIEALLRVSDMRALVVRAGDLFGPCPGNNWFAQGLWRESFELDNAKLLAFLGSESHTPWESAVGASLQGLGCAPQSELLSA